MSKVFRAIGQFSVSFRFEPSDLVPARMGRSAVEPSCDIGPRGYMTVTHAAPKQEELTR
jgi:hypothetical protein